MSIKFKRNIKARPDVVFKAITTKKGYQGWWTRTCEIDCAVHHDSFIWFEKKDITEEMIFKTLEVSFNEKLLWFCFANNVFPSWVGTKLEFIITTNDSGTELNFIQTSEDDYWHKNKDYANSNSGWGYFMDSLKSYCETGEGQPWES